mmetsp:Transcript_19015/g.34359  ORF Transcript_19015/g.34359 Transcript_19015/m.34359 type:complete len:349 (-) Transcript_19015:94-1140(-)
MAKTVVLKTNLDEGIPGPELFEIVEAPMPKLGDGVLVQVLAMSVDPYMRPRLRTGGGYVAGKPLSGLVSGRILESAVPEWKPGDLFGGSLIYSDFQAVSASALKSSWFWKLPEWVTPEQISLGIGALGMPGSTAYGGLIDILRPNKGETIWVSGAAGAVGSMVGMLAKNIFGCTVIGSAGGPEKCKLVKEFFGFDHCVDYKLCKSAKELGDAVKMVAPKGIDMYFENVGGMHFEAAMRNLRTDGRIAVCGVISVYNDKRPEPNKVQLVNMIYTHQRIEGFDCFPWITGQRGNFHQDMAKWVKEGHIKVQETHFQGIASFGEALKSLFIGGNTGKVVIRLPASPPASKL